MVVATKKKMVGCGHAGCVGKGGCTASLVPKGKKVGRGQAKKVGKGSGIFNPSETKEDQIYGESAPDETGRTTNKYGATVRRSGSSNRDDYRLRTPVTTSDDSVGGGQSRKKVGKGQAPPPDGMPPKKPRGAMPLPGAKVSRRHRPPMNKKPTGGGLGGPMAAMKPPMPPMGGMPGPAGPGGMPPMGGGAPMGPPMLPGAGAGGAPGMPPPRPPMPGMGQARKKPAAKKKTPAKGKK